MRPVFRSRRIDQARGYPFGDAGQPATVVVVRDLRAYRAFCMAEDVRKLVGPPPDPRRN